MDNKTRYAIRKVAQAIVETVREAGPDGAPETSVYLALAEVGASMAQYNALIDALVHVGELKRRGHLLVVE
jgi:hypothetical protein